MGISVSIKNLSHHINICRDVEVSLLENLNLTVSAGEKVAIVGASGSGKTTLLSLIAGLEPVQNGSITFEQSSKEVPLAEISSHSGFVFQQFHLIPELDALNNVALPLKLKGDPSAISKAEQWLDKVGLAARATFNVSKLSGGEQQRVAIARAFVTQPSIIFADEPTGNLDEETAAQVSQLMLACCEEHSTSLVLITHNSALAQQLDCVYKLHQKGLELCQSA